MSIECLDHNCRLHNKQIPYCEQEHCIKCCPNCGEEDYIPVKVIWNIENYGSKTFNFRCSKCNKIIAAQLKRSVSISIVSSKISNNEIDDWGE